MSLADNARLFYCLNLAVLITAFLLPEVFAFLDVIRTAQ